MKASSAVTYANFSAKVVKLYLPDHAGDGVSASPTLLVQIRLARGSPTEIIVPLDKINRLNFEREVPGCCYLTPKGKWLVCQQLRLEVAQLLDSPSAHGVLYPSSGCYFEAGSPCYVAGDQLISAFPQVDQSSFLISDSTVHLAADSSLSADIATERLLRTILAYPECRIPTFAFSLFAALRSFWGTIGLPTACVLYLMGEFGHGKTTLAKKLCALYDTPMGQIADFYDAQSTEAAMRDALATARDRVIILDDICYSTNLQRQRQRRDLAASLIRAAANETSRIKKCGKRTLEVPCVASLVLTGEYPMETPSDITRCIFVKVERFLQDGCENDRMVAASALAAYLSWFCRNIQVETDLLRNEYERFRKETADSNLLRLQKSIFELDFIFGSFLRFASNAGSLDEDSQKKYKMACEKVFQDAYASEAGMVRQIKEKETVRLDQIILHGAQQARFPYSIHHGCLCVRSSDLTHFLQEQLKPRNLTLVEMTTMLRSQNLLLMDHSGKSTKKVNGIRLLHLRIPIKCV